MAAAKGIDPQFKGMRTHLLWPTRVSVMNLIDEGLLTAAENAELSSACSGAYADSVRRLRQERPREHMTPNDLNNNFFMDQQREIFDPDFPEMVANSPAFSDYLSVAKLWKLQHRLAVEHAIRGGGSRPQAVADFAHNVMFP